MKSIFVGDDGSQKGNMKFPNKESYSSYMQEQKESKYESSRSSWNNDWRFGWSF